MPFELKKNYVFFDFGSVILASLLEMSPSEEVMLEKV